MMFRLALLFVLTAVGRTWADVPPICNRPHRYRSTQTRRRSRRRSSRLDPSLDHILAADTKGIVTKGENYFGVIEGSTWVPDSEGGYLLFTDFAANVIINGRPTTRQLSVFLEKSGYTGSLADIAHEGRMTTTQYGAPL